MSFVDLHSHILPAIDDGSRDEAQSLEMLALAERDGTGVIAATPHSVSVNRKLIGERLDHLRTVARDAGLTIQIVPGCEVRFEADLADRFAAGEIVTLNDTQWLLLELSLRADWSPYLQHAVYDLQVAGASVILAHAERYPAVQRDPGLVEPLIAQGVLVQVNADSIAGRSGKTAGRTADVLVQRRMVHAIASDAHDTVHRPPVLSAAHARLRSTSDSEYAAWVADVPRRIIQGDPVAPCDPVSARPRSFFGRMFSRS
jgi:protein-tyrosine phosphatase